MPCTYCPSGSRYQTSRNYTLFGTSKWRHLVITRASICTCPIFRNVKLRGKNSCIPIYQDYCRVYLIDSFAWYTSWGLSTLFNTVLLVLVLRLLELRSAALSRSNNYVHRVSCSWTKWRMVRPQHDVEVHSNHQWQCYVHWRIPYGRPVWQWVSLCNYILCPRRL